VTTAREVFAKRKAGAIDEAYAMALELMKAQQVGDWDRKAFCWCLIDLIKRDTKSGNQETLNRYRTQLENVAIDPNDEVLQRGATSALSLCNPNGQQIIQAKALSKDGRHAEAAAIYRKVCAGGAADKEIQTSLGWELYKHAKQLITDGSDNLATVKGNFRDYLKLEVEKPSLLHSCFLQLAAKLAGRDKFDMLVFSRMWNLEYLRPEDFERYHADGKEYPSLAEKVIQAAGKEAAASNNVQGCTYIVPYLNAAIEQFPDNIWLKLDKAKVLISLGQHGEALAFGLEVTKAKVNDYWAWALVGDIVSSTDQQTALSCYCKALSCPTDDKYTGKVRLKLAQQMLEGNDLAAAKREIEAVIHSKEEQGVRIPDDAAELASQPWFSTTQSSKSNKDYYLAHTSAAEALLFSNMPWIDANVGDKVTDPGKEHKPKRRLFLKTSSIPTEVRIPESKIAHLKPIHGHGLKIKGEYDSDQRFHIYLLEARTSDAAWDVFRENIGVVDHINKEKHILHFIVDQKIDGVIPTSELTDSFVEGDAIAVRLSRYSSKYGDVFRVQHAQATDKQPSAHIKKEFCEEVKVTNGMGFTEGNIYLSPPLVAEHQIEDGQKVSGIAVLSYNKKRSTWGWKAISIESD
jgi:hypothetical protein